MLVRRNHHDTRELDQLINTFASLKINYVLITGDLTTTSQTKEFKQAVTFINKLEKIGIKVVVIPGNHDHYTKKAWKQKKFYRFFPDYKENGYGLKEDGVALLPLDSGWSLIALDTAFASPLTSSQGHFHPKTEKALQKILSSLPQQENILVMNHFPLFEQEKPQKSLLRVGELRALLSSYPNVRFYLHGHTHIHCLADLRPSHYPIILDSGSLSKIKNGSWNLLDLTSKSASIQVFRQPSRPSEWQVSEANSFQWATYER